MQSKHGKIRKRKTMDGEKNMFSGLLYCANCKNTLNYHFNQTNHDIKYFNCRTYNKGSTNKQCLSTHYIRVDFLEQVILQEIRRLTKFASKYENEFVKLVMGHSQKTEEFQREQKQKELKKLLARDNELDMLFNRMYEDNASGKIDDNRFAKMSKQYTGEQAELADCIKTLTAELEKTENKAMTTDIFIKTVRKYTRAKELTEIMLNELIEKIEVHQAERVDGVNMQRLTIHYNCVGSIEIPNLSKLPKTEVTINTRQGVTTSYASQTAMWLYKEKSVLIETLNPIRTLAMVAGRGFEPAAFGL
jgi:hypothetical protein